MTIRIQQTSPGVATYSVQASGSTLPMDLPAPRGNGPNPHDYFDTALGGCKAMTLMLYAQSKSIPLEAVDVQVERDDSEERKGIYRLTARLSLRGELSDAQVDELLAVAERCPIHKLMTRTDVQVSTLVARA